MKKPGKIKQFLQCVARGALSSIDNSRGWVPIIQESTLGAFQMDDMVALGNSLAHPTVYACISQIAYDIGKLGVSVTEEDEDGISTPVIHNTVSPLLIRPNSFQLWQKFIESWIVSLETYGNTYTLKVRNANKAVIGLYVLDPNKVEPLVADNGDVFYKLNQDNISKINKNICAVPASEIIHDTLITLFHPLIGVPPLYAGNLAIRQGLAIQKHSAGFFENKAQPGGILTAPGHIKKETADAIRVAWDEKFSGDNAGKVAVLGDGLQYTIMAQTAEESELIDQLGWSDEKICSVFKVPPYKVYVGKPPTYEDSEAPDRMYYSGCLQRLIGSIEALLKEGLSLPAKYGIQFNVEDLLRMDFSLKMKTATDGVKGGILSPDEGRKKFNLSPVKGGDTPYLQQQNYSLAALDERDKNNPAPQTSSSTTTSGENEEEEAQKFLLQLRLKGNLMGVDK